MNPKSRVWFTKIPPIFFPPNSIPPSGGGLRQTIYFRTKYSGGVSISLLNAEVCEQECWVFAFLFTLVLFSASASAFFLEFRAPGEREVGPLPSPPPLSERKPPPPKGVFLYFQCKVPRSFLFWPPKLTAAKWTILDTMEPPGVGGWVGPEPPHSRVFFFKEPLMQSGSSCHR